MPHSGKVLRVRRKFITIYYQPKEIPEIKVWIEEMNTKRLRRKSQRKDKNQEEYAFGRESFKDRMASSVKCIWYLKDRNVNNISMIYI